jgi:prevent-host-death family protein
MRGFEMTRTVSATEARVHFGELMRAVVERGDTVVVERSGAPKVVVLSVQEYERLLGASQKYLNGAVCSMRRTSWFARNDRDARYRTRQRSSTREGKCVMPSSARLCCDASLVVRLVTDERPSPIADQWDSWLTTGLTPVAPRLLCYEVTDAFCRYQWTGELSSSVADRLLRTALALPIEFHYAELHPRAMELAARFNRPASYDA